MGLLARVGGWLRRLFGAASSDTTTPGSPRRLSDLLTAASPIDIASAVIEGHIARVVLSEPLGGPPDEFVEQRLLEAAWRALREHPAEGPIRGLEIWAPPRPGRPPERALRRPFKGALDVSPPQPSRPLTPHPEPHFSALGEHADAAAGPPEPPDRTLRPLGQFLVIPERLAARLRARGVDPAEPKLSQLVGSLLSEAGYEIAGRRDQGRVVDLDVASAAGRVVVRCYASDGHVLTPTIDRFAFWFLSSGAGEGFFVTDGLLPFESRHWERDPRIHLLDRVGLQRLLEGVAARLATSPAGAG